jgi:hypothetical protein
MGSKANRNSGISGFVEELLEKDGLILYEKWFAHLTQLNPGQKITDLEVRDEMLTEIVPMVTEGNSLIMGKKDKQLVEDLLNRFLKQADLLR